MRRFLLLLSLCCCGYTSKESEVTGQFKKIAHETPLVCPNYSAVDLSLGVMRNGTGSMSTEDQWFEMEPNLEKSVRAAIESGAIVQATYDIRRVTWCVPDHVLTGFRVLEVPAR